MNAIQTRVFSGEVLTATSQARVVGRLHPFRGERIDVPVPSGLSIAEALDQAIADRERSRIAPTLATHVDGEPIPADWWPRVRLKPGATLTFHPVPQNGQILKTIMMLAVMVAAVVLAVPTGGASLALAGALGISAATAGALIGVAVVFGGTLALNALFPTRPPATPSNEQFAQLNSIQGAQNQANPFGPIQVVLGTTLQSPFYAAKSYTEIVGDDQYLRLLFCWGYGPLNIANLAIGQTPLASYSDIEIETRQGFVGDAPITLYPSEVNEQALNIELHDTKDDPEITEVAQGPEDDWATQTTGVTTDEISVDLTAPNGIFHVDAGSGNINAYEVVFQIQYRAVGAGSWTDRPRNAFFRSVKTARIGDRWAVTRGQYQVRVRKRVGDATDTNTKDTIFWTALRSFTNDHPIKFGKPLALTALRIKATGQLNGVVNTFNGICTSLVKAYSGSGGVWNDATASQWPPDLFRLVLQGPMNARPVADDAIDLTNLQDWWTFCVANGFKYNEVRTKGGSVYDCLADIAAAGRAVPTFIDGKWGVIWDRPADSIVQHFTPRNSWGFAGSKPYARLPHGWRVKFVNEKNGFTEDERIVYADGYDATNATLFEQQSFPGVTDPDLIWRHGRFHIAQILLRPEEDALSVGWENLICTRGDRVRVTHDVLLIGLASGRVKSVAGQVVTLDETVTIVGGQTYGVRFRIADPGNTSFLRAVDPAQPAGETNTLTLVGDLSAVENGCLFAFGNTDQESAVYRVKGITHQKDLIAQLTLVDDAPAISTADQGTIPAYVPNVTIPPDPFALPPQNLQVQQVFDGFGASVRALARLTWQVPRFGRIVAFEVQFIDIGGGGAWTNWETVAAPSMTSDVPVVAAGAWGFRVRCLFADGTVSAWTTDSPVDLQGLLAPPADIKNFRWSFVTGRSELDWDPVIDPRGISYEIRKGASWDAALVVGDALAQPRFQTVGDETYWVAAFVVSPFGTRVYSATKQSLSLTDTVLTNNVVVSHDEGAEGWTGTLTGSLGIDQQQHYLRSGGSDNILANTDVLGTGDVLNAGGQGGGTYLSQYVVNAGRLSRCRVSVDYEATAVSATANFLADPSILDNPDVLQAYLVQFVRVYPIIRTAQSSGSNVLAIDNMLTLGDLLNAGVQWGAWQKWSPDVYVGTLYQVGLVVDILDPTANAIAYVLKFAWTIDVEDRLDRYQNLTIPPGGATITFEYGGYNGTATGNTAAFIGGPNDAAVPHVLGDILNAPTLKVAITSVTSTSCLVKVLNASTSADVGGAGVNVFAQGY